MKAIRDGAIDKQYRFSAEGIHKYNKDEIASMNGGWFKHESDQTTQRLHGQTLSKLKAQRKQTKKDEATQIAQKYLTDKQNNKIKIDFPYAFADKHPNNEKSKELVIENPNKTRSQLLDRRRQCTMNGLEQSRVECEAYFEPIAFRKLDVLEASLRKRSLHKSIKTKQSIVEQRHAQNKQVGKYWESRTNFDIFNAKKMEREFWKNGMAQMQNENREKRQIHKMSNEIYNFAKKRNVSKLPPPFQCESDSFKVRKRHFLSKPIGIEKQSANTQSKANDRLNFEQFSKQIGEVPDNLCVLHGGRSINENEDGVASWFRQRVPSLHDTEEMFSSFASDGIFREPVYASKQSSNKKTNLFKQTMTTKRPKTALGTSTNYTNKTRTKKKKKVRTSGFGQTAMSNSSSCRRLRVTL